MRLGESATCATEYQNGQQSEPIGVAPDGSPVAVYLAISGDAEAALIHSAIRASASVLELVCGVGRVTRHLVARGHRVTGVDNSEAMLAEFARVEGTDAVVADIASPDLGRTWPAVVLASHMINGAEGSAFLLVAARHLCDDGVLLVQRYEPGWVDAAEPTVAEHHRVGFELTDVDHRGSGVVAATAVYTVDGTVYRQAFIAYEVDDDRLKAMAASAGVELLGYLDHDPTWVKLGRTASRTAVP